MSLLPEQPIQNGLVGAVALTKRLLHEITSLSRKFDDCENARQQEDWFSQVNGMFDWMAGMEEGSLMGQAAMLINLESVWPDLPIQIREKYHNSFHFFAEMRTGKKWTTLENHMRAVRTFFIDQVGPTDSVPIPRRDQSGAIVLDTADNPTFVRVKWDPTTVPIAKLVAITAKAKAGQMTERLWSVAADSRATWEQMQIALAESANSGGNGTGGGGGDDFQFYMTGGLLFARQGNTEAFVGDLSLPRDDDDINFRSSDTLRERALRRLVAVLNVKIEGNDAEAALRRTGLQYYPREGVDIQSTI
jgi:hypothetical protein